MLSNCDAHWYQHMCLSRIDIFLCLVACLAYSWQWNAVNICQAKWNPFSKYKPSSAASRRLRCLLINLPLFDSVVLRLHNNWLGSAQNQDINVRVEALNFCYFARDSFLVAHFWRISPSVSQSLPVQHYSTCVFMCSLPFSSHKLTLYTHFGRHEGKHLLVFTIIIIVVYFKHPVSPPCGLQGARTISIFFDSSGSQHQRSSRAHAADPLTVTASESPDTLVW